jgi:hypothetical protein
MNPARSFRPALASGERRDFWVYMVGALAGAELGALAHQLVRGEPEAGPADGEPDAIQADSRPSVELPA